MARAESSLAYGGFIFDTPFFKHRVVVVGLGLALCLPMILSLLKPYVRLPKGTTRAPERKLFLAGSVFLTVFIGALIPSTFIAASPQEFADLTFFFHPAWYVVNTLCLAAGTFLIWMQVFYWLASPKGKVIFERLMLAMCGVALVNYMFFGTKLGIISPNLKYDNGLNFSAGEMLVNLLVLLAVGAVLYFLGGKWRKGAVSVLLVAALALGGMSGLRMVTIQKSMDVLQAGAAENETQPEFQLSKTGNNVVVFMLDRAMGVYLPYLMNENPSLEKQFDGFTYYPNTISFGPKTLCGVTALYGGYEYTPVELNRRETESMVDKHNESLKMLPVLFSENGYDVTVCDPPSANFQWVPDLSIFDDHPEIHTYITSGKFAGGAGIQTSINNRLRNFFCFSMMKSMPLILQPTIYNDGKYNQAREIDRGKAAANLSDEAAIDSGFMAEYSVLTSLPEITQITSKDVDTCLVIANSTTHQPIILQEPEYVPVPAPDNSEYDAQHADRFTLDGVELKMPSEWELSHYQANMAALMQLGNWFDYMKENGVYDNTRIIVVSDHGFGLEHIDELLVDSRLGGTIDLEYFRPLLMVKDFGSRGFTTSDEFMTNADVPTLAVQDLLEEPTNPYTGKAINSDEKFAHEQFVIFSHANPANDPDTPYLPAWWWLSVSGDATDPSNWTVHAGNERVLKEHRDDQR